MKAKKKQIEETTNPFAYFPHISSETIQNWLKARAYVLYLLKDKLEKADQLPQSWHFVVKGDNCLMLSVVRHLALYAHLTTFEETYDSSEHRTCKNYTLITLVSQKTAAEMESELKKEEYLCNLPDYCRFTVSGKTRNADSYIDVALELVSKVPVGVEITDEEKVLTWLATQQEKDISHIDVRKAVFANEAYQLGDIIDNLPHEDINCAERYEKALDAFRYRILESKKNKALVDEQKWKSSLAVVREGLSNIFCSDCFEIRKKEVLLLAKQDAQKMNDPKPDSINEEEVWRKYIAKLSSCEHYRWVVEKLILGYKPLGKNEIFAYEHLFGNQRKDYLKRLKKADESPKHIDICSVRDLRRIDPDNMKYDSFLMLAIPMILNAIEEQDKINNAKQ